jgi:predicted metal-binding transcription factor (methanogenesis marker protein 9)
MRDEILEDLGIPAEEFINIKEQFSKENDWDSDTTCFGSISYSCMRRGGCPRRDVALAERYPGMSIDDMMEVYFQKKKELSKRILESIKNEEGKDKAKAFLDIF